MLIKANEIEPFSCRNGLFPSENKSLELFTFNGQKGEKLYFYDDAKGCPSNEDMCKLKSFIIPKNEIIINKIQNGWACAWYQGKRNETVGWVKTKNLLRLKKEKMSRSKWLGKWVTEGSWINITNFNNTTMHISGLATWGVGDQTNTGELDSTIRPTNDRAIMDDEYACKVNLVRIGKYLIVSDNHSCGGLNVNFDGVYLKK